MPFVAVPNVVEAEVRALFQGQKIENRFMIDTLATVDSTSLDAVAVLVNDWAQDTYFDQLPNAITLTEVVATDLSAADGEQHTIAPTGTFTGAIADAAMPNEVTFCISHRSTARGRSARGRSYVLGITKGDVTNNVFSSVRADAFVSAFETLRTRIATAGWNWVVVSYISGGVPRPGGPVKYTISTSLYTDLIVDSMRRRKPGVGS